MEAKQFILIILFFLPGCSLIRHPGDSVLEISPGEVAEKLTSDLLSRPDFMMYKNPGVSAVHYAEALTAYGAARFAGLAGDKETLDKIVSRYERVTGENILNTANHVDANVYGVLPLEIYTWNKNPEYLRQGLELADGQWTDTIAGGLSSQTRYWIDDIFMIGCLQVQAYRATGKNIYLERAALEINSYIQKLQQPNGLFYHGVEAPFFWGRGNGWVAAGLAELLSELPGSDPHYDNILSAYKKMMGTLLENQDEDGMWHQLIDHPGSFKEASSTAMFGFAMNVGVKKGFLPAETFSPAYLKAWNALTGYLDEEGKIREVCVGTGQSTDVTYYLNRPRITGDLHGHAPMLWFACSLQEKK